jgi:hypothetical protein
MISIGELVDAVDRADVHAGAVFDVDAGLGVMYVIPRASLPTAPDASPGQASKRRARRPPGAPAPESGADSTWSKPAVCARCGRRVRVVREPEIGVSGQASATSSASTAAMSQMHEIGRVDAVARHEAMPREQVRRASIGP